MRRITITRRDGLPAQFSGAPVANHGGDRCGACGQPRDSSRRAEAERLENVNLRRRVAELEEELRRGRSAEQVAQRLRDEAGQPKDGRPDEPPPSPTEHPIAGDDQQW